jgi:5-formyltetrahydrofolate cyclo-ligase
MHKEELRRQIRQMKRQFTPQQLEELSLPVIQRLRSRLADYQVVFAYYSLPDEVCTHQLVDDLLAEGKTVLLPKVVSEEAMEWRTYTGRQDLQEGTLRILEPVGNHGDCPLCEQETKRLNDMETVPVILVPGMAFDAKGHRLGRGRGYYDRFLAAYPHIYKIGVCFDFQKVEEVPTDDFDIPVNEVI